MTEMHERAGTAVDGPVDYISPHWDRAALVLIDVQHDFLDDGAAPIAGTSRILPQLARLASAFRAAGRPIVHVVRLYETGGSDVDLPRRAQIENGSRVVAPDSHGSQIPAGLLPSPVILDAELLRAGRPQPAGDDEVILFKPRWSAFHRTQLEEWLRDRGCDTVVVAGCNLPNCPRATLFDASERDFRAALIEDAVSQATPERLGDLESIGVATISTADALAALVTDERT